jgi:hypothetical protein
VDEISFSVVPKQVRGVSERRAPLIPPIPPP